VNERDEITLAEIEQCKAVLGGLYTTAHDPRLVLPLPNQVAHIVKLVTAMRPEFTRSVPVRATDYDEVIPQVIVRLLAEVERLRAENEALRVDLAWANRRIDDMEATIDRLSVTWELP
jgi:hypothetical protein